MRPAARCTRCSSAAPRRAKAPPIPLVPPIPPVPPVPVPAGGRRAEDAAPAAALVGVPRRSRRGGVCA
eukprot:scaffold48608_cov63-Phaeocystis_antarctica.AAC.4